MNEATFRQWLLKADHDVKIGKDELATEEPTTDLVCFHMQQGQDLRTTPLCPPASGGKKPCVLLRTSPRLRGERGGTA
jgi:hypothetical protein